MIQAHTMLEDYSGLSQGGMLGSPAPLHHHPPHHNHPPHHHHHHHHHHHQTGVYMKPVYNLSSLCHQGPLTPPEKMSPTQTQQTTSGDMASPIPAGGTQLQHLPAFPHGAAASGGARAPCPELHHQHHPHPGHYRPHISSAGLTVPVLPAKKFRGEQAEILRCKRRVDLGHKLGYKTHPTAVARRNERERNRVKHINSTFATLRQHIPCAAKNKKMSKVETLRSAIRYINHLQQILETQKAEEEKDVAEEVEEETETQHQRRQHHHHLQHHRHHHPITAHLFSPTSSSLGSPDEVDLASSSRSDCDVTSRMRSSVLLSPPRSPASCDGRPGSADSHGLSPRGRYDYVTGLHDGDDEGDDLDDDVDDDVDDDEDQHDLSHFADWF